MPFDWPTNEQEQFLWSPGQHRPMRPSHAMREKAGSSPGGLKHEQMFEAAGSPTAGRRDFAIETNAANGQQTTSRVNPKFKDKS